MPFSDSLHANMADYAGSIGELKAVVERGRAKIRATRAGAAVVLGKMTAEIGEQEKQLERINVLVDADIAAAVEAGEGGDALESTRLFEEAMARCRAIAGIATGKAIIHLPLQDGDEPPRTICLPLAELGGYLQAAEEAE